MRTFSFSFLPVPELDPGVSLVLESGSELSRVRVRDLERLLLRLTFLIMLLALASSAPKSLRSSANAQLRMQPNSHENKMTFECFP